MPNLIDTGRAVLENQSFNKFLGTELVVLDRGSAVLALDIRPGFLQQHGFVHGDLTSYLIDNALTFAGGSVLGERVITTEYKVNYLRPARGERLVADAVVEGFGQRLAVCRCVVTAHHGEKESRCAVGLGTISVV